MFFEIEKQIYLNDFKESNEENWFTFLYHIEQNNIEYAYDCLIIFLLNHIIFFLSKFIFSNLSYFGDHHLFSVLNKK